MTIAAGSGNYFPLGIHFEVEALVNAGLTLMAVISAATGVAAQVLNTEDIGSIDPGKLADLILLDANPLEDIRNTREIRKVIQGGRVVDREGLLERAREMRGVEYQWVKIKIFYAIN